MDPILRTEEIGSVCDSDSDVSNTVSLWTDIKVVDTGVLESFLTMHSGALCKNGNKSVFSKRLHRFG